MWDSHPTKIAPYELYYVEETFFCVCMCAHLFNIYLYEYGEGMKDVELEFLTAIFLKKIKFVF